MRRHVVPSVTSVTITDPLVKYNALIATGVCSPDTSQYRLAHHLQKLYLRLKDYIPAQEHRARLQQIARAVDAADDGGGSGGGGRDELATKKHPIRRNPLFARFFEKAGSEASDSLALTRILTSQQAALHIDSPKGLFLSGEVGTGKSMLLDLLAEGLPTRRKKRWHFNTFMLHAFSRLEQFRKSRPQLAPGDQQYSILWMAKEMVEQSPILFLDEFQLPDRAASKIMSNLFITFFQLGGVLIVSSNRMPEELEKATGSSYSPPATGGLVEKVLGLGKRRFGGELFGQSSDFAAFLDVLKARCDFWHIEGTKDWRRREVSDSQLRGSGDLGIPMDSGLMDSETFSQPTYGQLSQGMVGPGVTPECRDEPGHTQATSHRTPAMFFVPSEGDERWTSALRYGDESLNPLSAVWEPSNLVVYGRQVIVPRQHDGFAYWNFTELVSSFGPADYITLASNYHTFIIDQVPILTLSMKNEARRFITLLDALYESRCKLVIRAGAGPDDLFFPEMRKKPLSSSGSQTAAARGDDGGDAMYAETIAEVFQDQVSPFRPNISTYADSSKAKYDPDQDSDFGLETERKVDFGQTGAFTGEDERFAYKRATSRLWQLCSWQWHSREGDWWKPLPGDARHWEGSEASRPVSPSPSRASQSEIVLGPSTELTEPAGLERFGIAHYKKGEKKTFN